MGLFPEVCRNNLSHAGALNALQMVCINGLEVHFLRWHHNLFFYLANYTIFLLPFARK